MGAFIFTFLNSGISENKYVADIPFLLCNFCLGSAVTIIKNHPTTRTNFNKREHNIKKISVNVEVVVDGNCEEGYV